MSRLFVPWLALLVALGTSRGFGQEAGVQKAGILLDVKAADPRLNPAFFLLSPEVVAEENGAIRLAKSTLLAHEMGATDNHQGEALGAQVWAKKVFTLPAGPLPDA